MKYSLSDGVKALGQNLVDERLMIMVGSGMSVAHPSNLPDWDGLLKAFVEECEYLAKSVLPGIAKDNTKAQEALDDFIIKLNDAKTHKNQGRVASVLKTSLKRIQEISVANLDDNMNEWLQGLFARADPNANHKAIVKTRYPVILTSNYDLLLEAAARKEGVDALAARSFDYTKPDQVAAALFDRQPAIVHMHGRYTNVKTNDIVFTAEDYVRIRKENPAFTMTLQALFLGYSTLFVGYGSSDPHLEDFLDEMGYFFKAPYKPRSFILLREDKANKVFVDYKHELGTDVIVCSDYAETTKFLEELRTIAPR